VPLVYKVQLVHLALLVLREQQEPQVLVSQELLALRGQELVEQQEPQVLVPQELPVSLELAELLAPQVQGYLVPQVPLVQEYLAQRVRPVQESQEPQVPLELALMEQQVPQVQA